MKNVLQYLEDIVSRFPDAVAVADRDSSYTFSVLQRKAGGIGRYLARYGLKNAPIGVFGNRQAETPLLFFSVLYSGNFYVPIDPDMPAEKMKKVMTDAGLTLILGSEENRAAIEATSFGGEFLPFSSLAAMECESVSLPDTEKEDPLYLIYTSGSTGEPKGVLKSHAAMISFIEAYTQTFSFSQEDVIGNQTPFFFDASAKDLYLMLKTGAQLQILPTEFFSFPAMLIRYMNERRVSFISWVPTALSLVVQLGTLSEVLPEYLKKVFFVGEALPAKHLRKWMDALPQAEYVNLYGSSETAGICCYSRIETPPEDGDKLPVGKALKNCDVFLMRDGVRITRMGEVGELYIAGPSLADGYYHDEARTAAVFRRLTLPDGTEKRVFCSGDLAEYDADGNFIFVSRKDSQIKHMGHRIELGEIEHAAMTIPQVQRCCCLYDQNKKKIILICETAAGAQVSSADIRQKLKTKLSDYMLPKKVCMEKALPLNANGKTDRELLKKKYIQEC